MYMDGFPLTEISATTGISRVTLTKWKKRGLPVYLSGGVTWDDFRERHNADIQQKAIVKRSVQVQKSSLDFLEQTKNDVQSLFENLKTELIQNGADKLSYGDIEKLLNIFIRLDNQGAEKILWQQNELRKIFAVVLHRVKDERVVLQIRNDLIGIAAAEQQKMGDMPGKEFLPTPVDMVVVDEETLNSLESQTDVK